MNCVGSCGFPFIQTEKPQGHWAFAEIPWKHTAKGTKGQEAVKIFLLLLLKQYWLKSLNFSKMTLGTIQGDYIYETN